MILVPAMVQSSVVQTPGPCVGLGAAFDELGGVPDSCRQTDEQGLFREKQRYQAHPTSRASSGKGDDAASSQHRYAEDDDGKAQELFHAGPARPEPFSVPQVPKPINDQVITLESWEEESQAALRLMRPRTRGNVSIVVFWRQNLSCSPGLPIPRRFEDVGGQGRAGVDLVQVNVRPLLGKSHEDATRSRLLSVLSVHPQPR